MYSTVTDVANIATQLLGVRAINALSDSSLQAQELSRAFDKMRQAELRAHAWRFAIRSAALRPMIGPALNAAGLAFPTWAVGTGYNQGDIVNDPTTNTGNGGTALYLSLVGSNTGNTPSSSPASWTPYFGPDTYSTYSSSNTYLPGEITNDSAGSGSKLYLCTALALNQTPHSSASYFAGPLTGATTATFFEPWPLGYFNTSTTQRNSYRLPPAFMRITAQDPKLVAGASYSTVGSGQQFNDWQMQGRYLSTAQVTSNVGVGGPLVLRFCADISDVTQWEPLFATLVGYRLAHQTRERLNPAKDAKVLLDGYVQAMAWAVRDDLIEQGSTDPEDDQFLTAALSGYGLMPGGGQSQK